MKNDKTMKTKTKIPTLKSAAAAPAVKASPASAIEVAPARPQSAKAPAAATPVTPAAPVVKPPAPVAPPTVVASAPARPMVPSPAPKQAAGRREITTDLIALRAYNLWEQQGRPQGHEVANWLLAESQLKQEVQSFTA